MKKSLSRQFIAILLIPVILILLVNYYTVSHIRQEHDENLKRYCSTTLNNTAITIASMTTSMKKTSTKFASTQEMQAYLLSASANAHELQRQSFFDLVDLSKSYTPDLVDIIVWDHHSPTSIISYIPAAMEDFAVSHFRNDTARTDSYFEIFINPVTDQPYLIYFSPVFMTTFSKDFGKYLGNIAVICKTDTISKLVNSTTDISLDISDDTSGQTLYSNAYTSENPELQNQVNYREVKNVPATNLSITGTIYTDQVQLFSSAQSHTLLLMAFLSLLYLLYIAFAVHHLIIRPIRKLNEEIESMDYAEKHFRLRTSLQNEIGSIASHINALLTRVSSLNQRNITSQARLYEMEISKKQTQLYAYQSQINPHFLYNMLQCMRGISLMHGINEVALICTNMADLFRYSIKGAFLVSLEDEISIINKYLYMIQVRFQNKITYQVDISDEACHCKIPKMVLQPLVENAIFHGLESIEDNGQIRIRAYLNGRDLFITIWDNGIGFDQNALEELNTLLGEDIPPDINATVNESKGLGILNIHNKIRLYEGNDYGISIQSMPGDTLLIVHLNAAQTQ